MPGDVIVTVTLNAPLHVCYAVGDVDGQGISRISRPSYHLRGHRDPAASVGLSCTP